MGLPSYKLDLIEAACRGIRRDRLVISTCVALMFDSNEEALEKVKDAIVASIAAKDDERITKSKFIKQLHTDSREALEEVRLDLEVLVEREKTNKTDDGKNAAD